MTFPLWTSCSVFLPAHSFTTCSLLFQLTWLSFHSESFQGTLCEAMPKFKGNLWNMSGCLSWLDEFGLKDPAFSCWMCTFGLTLPETNSLPLSIGHPKRKFIFQPLILRCNVSFTEWIQLLFRSRGVSLNRQFCFEFPNHFNKKTQAENGWWFRNPAPVDMININIYII